MKALLMSFFLLFSTVVGAQEHIDILNYDVTKCLAHVNKAYVTGSCHGKYGCSRHLHIYLKLNVYDIESHYGKIQHVGFQGVEYREHFSNYVSSGPIDIHGTEFYSSDYFEFNFDQLEAYSWNGDIRAHYFGAFYVKTEKKYLWIKARDNQDFVFDDVSLNDLISLDQWTGALTLTMSENDTRTRSIEQMSTTADLPAQTQGYYNPMGCR